MSRMFRKDDEMKRLSSEFWVGKRWIVVDAEGPDLKLSESICFYTYQNALDFCRAKGTRDTGWKISVLSNVLKVYNDRMRLDPFAFVYSIIEGYPIESHSSCPTLTKDLQLGLYCPLYWTKTIEPLLDIRAFYIVYTGNIKGKMVYYFSKPVVAFEEAHNLYFEKDRFTVSPNVFLPGVRMLIGVLDNEIVPNNEMVLEMPASAFVIYRNNFAMGQVSGDVEMVNDVCSGIKVKHLMFGRLKGNKLLFFDGSMKKVRPGMSCGIAEFERYLHVNARTLA